MREYTIITKLRVFIDGVDVDPEELFKEQLEKLEILGFDYCNGEYYCHFFNSGFFNESTEVMELPRAIECLAIKEGVDLVQFDNGNYGFIAYYNEHENGFEIIG